MLHNCVEMVNKVDLMIHGSYKTFIISYTVHAILTTKNMRIQHRLEGIDILPFCISALPLGARHNTVKFKTTHHLHSKHCYLSPNVLQIGQKQ